MPRNSEYFSPSQVRTRLRRALRPYTGRGGGIALRALHTVNWDATIDLRNAGGTEVHEFNTRYTSMSGRCIGSVSLISEALQNPEKLHINRLWHVAVMHGRDIERANVYTLWIGNHESPCVVIEGYGMSWLCDMESRLVPSSLLPSARAEWDNLLTTRSSSTPTLEEETES